jgi:hypothetical protein
MGGAVTPVAKLFGAAQKSASQTAQNVADATSNKPAEPTKPSRMDEEQGARMRGARRRGRQLLSDARLNAESGVETLGGGQSLG